MVRRLSSLTGICLFPVSHESRLVYLNGCVRWGRNVARTCSHAVRSERNKVLLSADGFLEIMTPPEDLGQLYEQESS